jgi:hypothetical protein
VPLDLKPISDVIRYLRGELKKKKQEWSYVALGYVPSQAFNLKIAKKKAIVCILLLLQEGPNMKQPIGSGLKRPSNFQASTT